MIRGARWNVVMALTQLRRLGHVLARQPRHSRVGDGGQSRGDTPNISRVAIEVSWYRCADHGDVHRRAQVHLLLAKVWPIAKGYEWEYVKRL